MVHMLASHLRSEFLAVPQLVRLDMAEGRNGFEPTLLIKVSSLAIKYLLRRRSMRVFVATLGQQLLYGLEVPDDPEGPAIAWSLVELPAEVEALRRLMRNPRCVVFLFNELAVSVSWTEVDLHIDPRFEATLQDVALHSSHEPADNERVGTRLDEVRGGSTEGSQVVAFDDLDWTEIHATYITNSMGHSSLSLFSSDEGGQQEEIAVWLTDSLQPAGCAKGPFVETSPRRELSDVLLTYEFGTILIESKALNVLSRDVIPTRQKLASDLIKHVEKAARQLAGGIRNLKSGVEVTDATGRRLEVERAPPVQAIILVPDLSLLQDATHLGPEFIGRFMEATGGFLYILDPAELLRLVQAAEMAAATSQTLTPLMGFDHYLLERAKIAMRSRTPDFSVLFRRAPADANLNAS